MPIIAFYSRKHRGLGFSGNFIWMLLITQSVGYIKIQNIRRIVQQKAPKSTLMIIIDSNIDNIILIRMISDS